MRNEKFSKLQNMNSYETEKMRKKNHSENYGEIIYGGRK